VYLRRLHDLLVPPLVGRELAGVECRDQVRLHVDAAAGVPGFCDVFGYDVAPTNCQLSAV